MKSISLLIGVLLIASFTIAQKNEVAEKYRLSGNYAPHVINNYVVTYQDGVTRILNKDSGEFLKDEYQYFGTDNNDFWGLKDGFWCFGTCDSAIVSVQIPQDKIESLESLGSSFYITSSKDKKLILYADPWKKAYKITEAEPFKSVLCHEFEQTVMVSKNFADDSLKFGCLSLETGEFISEFFVDSVITCPRVFNEVGMMKKDGKYLFYDFISSQPYGKEYIAYKRVPIYNTVMVFYDNGVELIENKKISSFDIGRIKSVDFESVGDFVYANIKSDKGEFKIDIWEKRIIND